MGLGQSGAQVCVHHTHTHTHTQLSNYECAFKCLLQVRCTGECESKRGQFQGVGEGEAGVPVK